MIVERLAAYHDDTHFDTPPDQIAAELGVDVENVKREIMKLQESAWRRRGSTRTGRTALADGGRFARDHEAGNGLISIEVSSGGAREAYDASCDTSRSRVANIDEELFRDRRRAASEIQGIEADLSSRRNEILDSQFQLWWVRADGRMNWTAPDGWK